MWPVRTIGADRKLIDFAFSPDQRRVAFCENSTQAEILVIGSSQRIILETESPQPDVVFSPDGKLLATGGYATEARIWEVATGKLIYKLDCGPDIGGLTPVFNPDGRTIAFSTRGWINKAGTRICLSDGGTSIITRRRSSKRARSMSR